MCIQETENRQTDCNQVTWAARIFNRCSNVTLSKSFWTLCFVACIVSLHRKAGHPQSCAQQGLVLEVISVLPDTSQACLIILEENWMVVLSESY